MLDLPTLIARARELLKGDPAYADGRLTAYERSMQFVIVELLVVLETAQTDRDEARAENLALRRVTNAAQKLIDDKVNRSGFDMDFRSLDGAGEG